MNENGVQFFRGFQKGMKGFGLNISTIVNTVLLSVVYVVGVGLTSILAKISKKRFLEMTISEEKETYWDELNLKKKSMEEYYRQF
ncbi:MAG: hypothetical protein HYW24_03865 [Candidatus Aenigmarchaeota archaeon]|nr:hypothetical protein [Candidatus Aenigmarchaeota archaeon]